MCCLGTSLKPAIYPPPVNAHPPPLCSRSGLLSGSPMCVCVCVVPVSAHKHALTPLHTLRHSQHSVMCAHNLPRGSCCTKLSPSVCTEQEGSVQAWTHSTLTSVNASLLGLATSITSASAMGCACSRMSVATLCSDSARLHKGVRAHAFCAAWAAANIWFTSSCVQAVCVCTCTGRVRVCACERERVRSSRLCVCECSKRGNRASRYLCTCASSRCMRVCMCMCAW